MVRRRGRGCLCQGTRMPLFLFCSTLFWSHLERSQSLHTDPSGAKSPSQQSRGGEPAEAVSEPGSRVGCCTSGRASCALQPWIWGEPPTAGSSQGPGGHQCPGRLPGKSNPCLGLLFQARLSGWPYCHLGPVAELIPSTGTMSMCLCPRSQQLCGAGAVTDYPRFTDEETEVRVELYPDLRAPK